MHGTWEGVRLPGRYGVFKAQLQRVGGTLAGQGVQRPLHAEGIGLMGEASVGGCVGMVCVDAQRVAGQVFNMVGAVQSTAIALVI